MNTQALVQSSLILLAIVNPVGSIPIFLQLTHHMTALQRRQALRAGILTALLILIVFVLAGEWLVTRFFQIGISDLMIAGGVLLLVIAIDHLVFGAMVRSVSSEPGEDSPHIGAVPIGCPILAGPGAMLSVFVTYSQHGLLVAVGSIVVVMGLTAATLFFIDRIYGYMGKIVCMVLSKILCLFLAAVGIHLLMQGLSSCFRQGG